MGALSLVKADADGYAVLTQPEVGDTPLPGLRSVAVTVGHGDGSAWLRRAEWLRLLVSTEMVYVGLAGYDAADIAALEPDMVRRLFEDMIREWPGKVLAEHLEPLYMICDVQPEHGECLRQMLAACEQQIPLLFSGEDALPAGVLEVVKIEHPGMADSDSPYVGLKVNVLPEFLETLIVELEEEGEMVCGAEELRSLQGRCFYLLGRVVDGHKLVVVLCENPDEIALPASEAESLLASARLDAADARMSELLLLAEGDLRMTRFPVQMGMVALFGPSWMAVCTEPHMLLRMMALVVDAVRDASPDAAARYEAAVAAMRRLADATAGPAAEQPAALAVWQSGRELHAELRCRGAAPRFSPGALHYTPLATAPGVQLYAECTPTVSERLPEVALSDVAEAFGAWLRLGVQSNEASPWQKALACDGALRAVAADADKLPLAVVLPRMAAVAHDGLALEWGGEHLAHAPSAHVLKLVQDCAEVMPWLSLKRTHVLAVRSDECMAERVTGAYSAEGVSFAGLALALHFETPSMVPECVDAVDAGWLRMGLEMLSDVFSDVYVVYADEQDGARVRISATLRSCEPEDERPEPARP